MTDVTLPRLGVDLIEIERIAAALARHGDAFLQRIYTPDEQAAASARTGRRRHAYLATRFAAKEAVAKALGTGIGRAGVRWTSIEVLNDPVTGAPLLRLVLPVALGTYVGRVSISDTRTHAMATVLLQCAP